MRSALQWKLCPGDCLPRHRQCLHSRPPSWSPYVPWITNLSKSKYFKHIWIHLKLDFCRERTACMCWVQQQNLCQTLWTKYQACWPSLKWRKNTTQRNVNSSVLDLTKLSWRFEVAHLLSSWKSVSTTEHYFREGGMTGEGTTTFLTCFCSPFQRKPGTDFCQISHSETRRSKKHRINKSLGLQRRRESGHKPGFCQQQVTCI